MTLVDAVHPHRGGVVTTRQQILTLYLSSSDLSGAVTAWSFYDGASDQSESIAEVDDRPPYATGLEALGDGWRVIAWPRLENHQQAPFELGYLPHEFVFEKVIGVSL